jgi:hypothetical protein
MTLLKVPVEGDTSNSHGQETMKAIQRSAVPARSGGCNP